MIGAPEVTAAVIASLSPLLPYLVKAGGIAAKGFAEAVAKAGGEAAWKGAESLWARLTNAAADDKKLSNSMSLVATDPEETAYITAFARTLEARLRIDPELEKALKTLLGGEDVVQKMAAQGGSTIRNATQELDGAGEQTMAATDNSLIEGATQSAKR